MNNLKTKIKNIFTKPQPKHFYLLFFYIPLVYYAFGYQNLDNDFYFLYPTGKYIIEHGFPQKLIFTIHNGFDFIVQQWGTTIIFYFIYSHFGRIGMITFVTICYLLIMYLAYKLSYILSEKRSVSTLISCIISLLLATMFIRTRPQIFDYIIFLLEFIFLELYFKKDDSKYLIGLPILSFLLSNLHSSSFFLLFIFMLPYFINSFKFKILDIESCGSHKLPLILTAVLMLLTGLINPYGLKAINYIFTSYGSSYINNMVYEMRIPEITSSVGFFIYFTILVVLLVYYKIKNKKIEVRHFLLLLGTIFLSMTSMKAFPYFAIAGVFPLAYYIKDKFPEDKDFDVSKDDKIDFVIALFILIFMLVLIFAINYKNSKGVSIKKITDYIVNEEKKNKTKYKVYTNYDNGSYAEFRGLNVYIDPRAEAFLKSNNHKKDIIKEYYYLRYGGIDKEEFLKKYNFDYLIVRNEESLYKFYLNTNKNKLYKKIMTEKYNKKETNYLYEKIEK